MCLSHLRWNFVFQRPQHLLSRAAKQYRVVIFEETVGNGTITEPRITYTEYPEGVTVALPELPWGMTDAEVLAAHRRLFEELIEREGRPRVLWFYTPMAMEFSDSVDADIVVFDKMDELAAFKGAPPPIVAFETRLLERADVVFTGGQSLFEAARDRHSNVHAFPSSVDVAHFAQARAGAVPDPQDQSSIGRPRIGYFGVIDERLDIELVRRTAELKPDWQFVMIGPVIKIDPVALPKLPNIHWLGAKDYRELPAYLAHWDVGFMPFALNEATRFISPTKTPEFLAAGLPVVSTAIRDVVRPYGEKGFVEIAATADGTVRGIEKVLSRPKEAWASEVDQHLATMSWDQTWSGMNALMVKALELHDGAAADGRAPASFNPGEVAHV